MFLASLSTDDWVQHMRTGTEGWLQLKRESAIFSFRNKGVQIFVSFIYFNIVTNMSSVFCWFDWDDNTTTVNSINIIKEPRKPWREYIPGEKVCAKLPQFGLWHGEIVEISKSKKDLVKKMNERQKLQLGLQTEKEDEDIHCDVGVVDGREENPTVETSVETVSLEKQSQDKKGKTGKKKGAEEEIKEEERKKKKLEDLKRLEAKNMQLESIIRERRRNVDKVMSNTNDMVNASASQMNNLSSLNAYSLSQPCTSSSGEFMSPAGSQDDLYGSQPFHDARCNAFRPYTYVGDLMSLPPATPPGASSMQPLWSFSEVQEKNRQLELENQRLREENEFLKEQLKIKTPTLDFDVTPRKVNFLKQLANSLESQNCATKKVTTAKPTRLEFDELECTAQPELEPHCKQLDVDSTNKMSWEESVTSSGVKKVKLVSEYEVYLTQCQLSQAIHTASSKPRKLTIALLDCFFTKEMLARSNAKGARSAHNAIAKSTPLPGIVIRVIKEFVLKHFKKDLGGAPCLTDACFNEIINNKCATARRALKSY